MPTYGDASITIRGDLSPFARDLKKAEQQADASSRKIGGSFSGLGNKLSASLTDADGGLRKFNTSATVTNARLNLVSKSIRMLKFPALIAGANLAAGGLSALGAGAVAAVSSLAPLTGLLASGAQSMTAMIQTTGVLTLATYGVKDAFAAAKEGGQAYRDALKDLSPAARAFVVETVKLRPVLEDLQARAAAGLFPGVTDALKNLKGLFPGVRSAVSDTARAMGGLARQAGEIAGTSLFRRDFGRITQSNVTLVKNFGTAGLNLGNALRHIVVAAIPLTEWLSRTVVRFSENILAMTKAGRESGKLADFFALTRTTVSDLFAILGNLGNVLLDVGKAAFPLGRDMMKTFRDLTAGWADFTGSVAGQNALKDFFDGARPALKQMAMLIGDLAKGFVSMSQGSGLAPLIKQLRTQFLPVLLDVLKTSSKLLGPALVDLATNFLRVFKIVGTESGPLIGFVKVLSRLFDIVADLLEKHPALASMVVTFGGLASASSALGLGAAVGGITRLGTMIAQVRTLNTVLGATKVAGAGAGAAIPAGGAAAAGGGAGLAITGGVIITAAATAVAAKRIHSLRQRVEALKDEVKLFGQNSKRGAEGIRELDEAAEDTGSTLAAMAGGPYLDLGDGTDDLAAAHRRLIKRLTGSTSATKDFDFIIREATDLTEKQARKIAATTGAFQKLGGRLTDTTRKQVQNLLAVGDYEGAMKLLNGALERSTGKHKGLSKGIEATEKDIVDAKVKVGLYRSDLDRIPEKVTTRAQFLIAQAMRAAASFKSEMEGIAAIKDISIDARFAAAQGDGPGAPVRGGGLAVDWARQAIAAVPGSQWITSTYRTPASNAAVGGSPTSYHMDRSNPAADIVGENLTAVNNYLARFPTRERLWQVPGHFDHVHVADQGLRIKGPANVRIGNIKEDVQFIPRSGPGARGGDGITYNIDIDIDARGAEAGTEHRIGEVVERALRNADRYSSSRGGAYTR